jgi:Ferritin-like domain
MTRRRLLARWLEGSLAAGAGVTPATIAGASPAPAQPADPDGEMASELLALELLSIAVYERVLSSRLLSPRPTRVTRKLLSHEHAHAAALLPELHQLGLDSPVAPASLQDVDQALAARHIDRRIEDLHTERDCLDLLLNVEGVAEGAYYSAMSKLQRPRLQRLAAELLASEAQHEAMLGLLRAPKDFDRAAPYAFVEGIHG